jgi:uncharacterized SAM-binding protein YcdF (DUF218 family)
MLAWGTQLQAGKALGSAADIRRVTQWLFLPVRHEVEPVDICLILGSRHCEYRVAAALARYGAGPHRFVVSGGGLDRAKRSEAERMQRVLAEAGVEAGRIWVEGASRHTRENLAHTKALLERRGLGETALKISLITAGFHLRRSLALVREEWMDCPQWTVSWCPAYGPHTQPDNWHDSREGRRIIGQELVKLQKMGVLDQS